MLSYDMSFVWLIWFCTAPSGGRPQKKDWKYHSFLYAKEVTFMPFHKVLGIQIQDCWHKNLRWRDGAGGSKLMFLLINSLFFLLFLGLVLSSRLVECWKPLLDTEKLNIRLKIIHRWIKIWWFFLDPFSNRTTSVYLNTREKGNTHRPTLYQIFCTPSQP